VALAGQSISAGGGRPGEGWPSSRASARDARIHEQRPEVHAAHANLGGGGLARAAEPRRGVEHGAGQPLSAEPAARVADRFPLGVGAGVAAFDDAARPLADDRAEWLVVWPSPE
jgi:hypothetical protein